LEHTTSDNAPRLVWVLSVVANDLGSQHQCGDEKAVTRRFPSGIREASLQTLKEDEGGKGDRGMQLRAMEGIIGNEVGYSGQANRWVMKRAHKRDLFVAVERT
jgi:hypothetical protein